MKKYVLLLMLLWVLIPIKAGAKEDVTVYVFTKQQETISSNLLAYINTIKEDCSCFDLVEYQIWDKNWNEDKQLRILADAVAEEFNNHVIGAPIMVVGNHFFDEYEEKMKEEIQKAIMDEVENDRYEDVVIKVKESIHQQKQKDKRYSYMLLGGIGVIVIIIVLLARKSTKKDSL